MPEFRSIWYKNKIEPIYNLTDCSSNFKSKCYWFLSKKAKKSTSTGEIVSKHFQKVTIWATFREIAIHFQARSQYLSLAADWLNYGSSLEAEDTINLTQKFKTTLDFHLI